MDWRGFWKGYDWLARADFANTLFGGVFDWRGLFLSVGGSALTFLWSAIREWDPLAVWLSTIGVGAGIAIIYVALRLRKTSQTSGAVAANEVQVLVFSKSHRAKIVFGTGYDFEIVQPSGVNRARTVSIRIENNTDSEIADGRIDILNLDPPADGHENLLLKGEIRLAPHKHTFIPVAFYNEGTSRAKPGTWIRLAIPIAPVYGGGPGNLPLQPHTFHLKFSSAEFGMFDEVACRLFVDSGHVLHLEDWANSATHHDAQIERHQISLFEAATRAYEQTRDEEASIFAFACAESDDDILTWYCRAMTIPHNGKPTLIKLMGNQPPSRIIEPIEMKLMNRYDFEAKEGAIILKERNGKLRFENLSVDLAELTAAIQEIKSWKT
jgi:hypothetical protein